LRALAELALLAAVLTEAETVKQYAALGYAP
jgi:hypothetical protein